MTKTVVSERQFWFTNCCLNTASCSQSYSTWMCAHIYQTHFFLLLGKNVLIMFGNLMVDETLHTSSFSCWFKGFFRMSVVFTIKFLPHIQQNKKINKNQQPLVLIFSTYRYEEHMPWREQTNSCRCRVECRSLRSGLFLLTKNELSVWGAFTQTEV